MIQQPIAATTPQPLARRAALTLHALGRADRGWVLSQLPADERERLQSMLAELTALGISAPPGMLQDVLDGGNAPAASASPPVPDQQPASLGHAERRAALGRVEPGVAARLLQHEPAGLVAQVLAIQNWPWRQAVLDQLAPARRRQVEETLANLRRQVRPAPEALHRALVTALHARLAGSPQAGTGRRPAWLARVPRWLRLRMPAGTRA